MQVSEAMSTDIAAVDISQSLAHGAKHMLAEDVGSVIVIEDGTPRGIVTESDVMTAALEADEPISAIPIETAMTSPVKTISPTENLMNAARKMKTHEVKRFPVMDRIELVGIITFSDLIWNVSELVEEKDSEEEFFSEPV